MRVHTDELLSKDCWEINKTENASTKTKRANERVKRKAIVREEECSSRSFASRQEGRERGKIRQGAERREEVKMETIGDESREENDGEEKKERTRKKGSGTARRRKSMRMIAS